MDIKIILWIMISIIILITLYLVFIYIISKSFRSYPCYLNIILSSVIAINNILRLIEIGEPGTNICYFQAVILAITDKLIFTTIVMNSILTLLGVINNELYEKKVKIFFIVLNIFGLLIALSFGIIFILLEKPASYENVCYVNGTNYKETSDNIITFCLYLIYLFCNIKLVLYLVKSIKELAYEKKHTKYFSRHYFRIVFLIFSNSFAFLIVILIINDSLFLDDNLIDLTYVFSCLIVDLAYSFNTTVVKETYKLFGCVKKDDNKNEIKEDKQNNDDINKNKKSERSSDDYYEE